MRPKQLKTLLKGTFQSKKHVIIIVTLIVATFIAIFVITTRSIVSDKAVAPVITQPSSAVMSLLSSYGDTTYLSNETMGVIEPIVVETNDVKVTVREIVYDGIWLYTSADICAISPESVLVMPGSAAIGDPCSGLNGELDVEDKRSFKTAAFEDGKRLLAVYVYPKEFDELGEYFLDHFQRSGGVSTFLSGARMSTENDPAFLTLSIQVYEVDLQSGKYTLLEEMLSNTQVVYPYVAVERQEYVPNDESAPFDSVLMLKSGIAIYVQPMLEGAPCENIDFSCYSKDGERILHGAALDLRALSLTDFPDQITLNVYGEGNYSIIRRNQ